MRIFISINFILSFLLILAGCGGGSKLSTDPNSTNPSTGLPNDINGLLVFDTYRPARGVKGIFTLEFNQGEVVTKKTITEGEFGQHPYAINRDTISYAAPCNGKYTHQVKVLTSTGLSSAPITECSSSIVTRESISGRDNSYLPIQVAKLSPDQSKLAVSFEVLIDMSTEGYLVIIYDANTGKEVKRYPKYAFPEWQPDGRLLLTPFGDDTSDTGIYLTDSTFTDLTRIDNNQINTSVRDLSISPSGKKLVFLMGSQVWEMGIDGSNPKPIISDNSIIKFPVWSPNGKYIAYLSFGTSFYHQKITFYDTLNGKSYIHSTENTFAPDADGTSTIGPSGPLSWVE